MNQNSVRVKVCGPFACWTRPEAKVERVSYECMTPSAARNILDAICWKPQMRWIVTRILVLRPIRFIALRRNELQSKLSPRNVVRWMSDPAKYEPQSAGAGSGDATPRNTLALRDVSYVIEAYPHVFAPNRDDTPVKYVAMLDRRVEKGQCYQRPYLGCREFAATFEAADPKDEPNNESVDLGRMLYDITFKQGGKDNRPVFFDAKIEGGVLVTDPEVVLPDPEIRREVLRCSYRP